jgi:hypothetical protein
MMVAMLRVLAFFTLHAKPFSMYNAPVIDNKLSEYFSAMGRKSAKARMKKLSAERRSEIASNAAKSRWAKSKKRKARKHGVGSR